MEFPVVYERKVRFSDTDAQGIVFNGNYLTYFDDTITDYIDALGIPWSDFHQRGVDLVLGRVEVDFRSPGRFGDLLCTGARVESFGNTSVVFALETWEERTGRPVALGKQIQVFVDHRSFQKTPVPGWFVEAVEDLQGPRSPSDRRAQSRGPQRSTRWPLDPDAIRPDG